MPPAKPVKEALILSFLYAGISLSLLSTKYDPLAVVNAVLAERGGFSAFELAHPLYTPLLSLFSMVLSAGWGPPPHMTAFQTVNVLFASASAGLSFLLLSACGLPRLAAGAAALCASFSGGGWHWAMQAKPYAPAFFFALAALYLLTVPEKNSKYRLPAAAALYSLACSFTVACAALLPVFFFSALPDQAGKKDVRRALMFTSVWALFLAVLYIPLLALKWSSISGLAAGGLFQALSAVPGGGTVLASKSLLRQSALFRQRFLNGNYALYAALTFAAAGALRRRSVNSVEPAIPPLAAAASASLWVFFLLVDPHNDFAYSVTALAVLAGAGLAAGVRPLQAVMPVLAGACIFSAMAGRGLIYGYPAEKDIYRNEAVFITSRLSGGDTLLCAGPPDWRLAYLLMGRVHMLQIAMGDNAGNFFAPELFPPGEALSRKLSEASSSGRRIMLASDIMFHPDPLRGMEETIQNVNGAVRWLENSFRLGAPEISPNGQYYYPLIRRKEKRNPRGE